MSDWGIPDWRDPAAYGLVHEWSLYRWRWEFYRRRPDLRDWYDKVAAQLSQENAFMLEGIPPNSMPTKSPFGYRYWLPNPRIADHDEEAIFADDSGLSSYRPWESGPAHVEVWAPSANNAIFCFDLDKPIEAQIAKARRSIELMQKHLHGHLVQRRKHPAKWLGYLRTLDARAAGAAWSEIAKLHVNTAQTEQTARDVWEQAQALCFNF